MKTNVYSVLVLMHPVNRRGLFELLFSTDGVHYCTPDGNSPEYFRANGLTLAKRLVVTPQVYVKLLSKVLGEKIKTLSMYVPYKDHAKMLRLFKGLSEYCVNSQCKYSEDLGIPECVITLANSNLVAPIHK